ncbi:protein serine/threonine phosphatase with extracellular sensor [Fluviicola taffensis DSM 16823]|uniref:Protein serine/threonine phosphatase with extracellular sensor n=1 Tax=Fluviicola taffensis (strain DSM 16823 / NCIMB 13979 / RW262) TaxID=755732 RepID=F2IKI9_FLUTR|nr:protein serine/threonine phosphatase with extracellular sensor [Fluviicola taffensis DSM 16823]
MVVLGGFGFVLLVFASFSWYFNQRIHEKQSLLIKLDNLSSQIQEHKDWMEEITNQRFWYDSVAKNEQEYRRKNSFTHENIRLKLNDIFSESNQNQVLIGQSLNNIQLIEDRILNDVAKIGFKEYGYIGKMREVIHNLEEEFPQFDQQILSLRRHEKDYIMRNDENYAKSLHAEIELWKLRKDYPAQLNQYLQYFDSVRSRMQLLFAIQKNNHYSTWTANMTTVQSNLRQLRGRIIQESYDLSNDSLKIQYIISGIAFLALIIGSIYIIRNISVQVSRLQKSMNDFIASNYQSDETITHQLPKNEIGQISIHFLKMARKIKWDLHLLEDRVMRRTIALHEKNVQLEKQHTEMMDSLRYAQKLQESLLVSRKQLAQHFEQAHIHYTPKNLVGGDFYWMKNFRENGSDKILFALADCTGHGVPGALLSVLGMNTLDELFADGIRKPNELLDSLRKTILRRISSSEEQRMDGMDIAIFCFDKRSRELHFAGAQMPLWIVRNSEVIELNGERVPIGFTYMNHLEFKSQYLTLEEDDKLVVFTDGIVDQFGMESNKKFGKKQLRYILSRSLNNQSSSVLYNRLMNQFAFWKGEGEQTDDCTFLILEPKFVKVRNSKLELPISNGKVEV